MKTLKIAALALGAIWAIGTTSSFGQIVIGTGTDASYVVIEASAFGAPLVYEYRYDYDVLNPLTGYALMDAVDAVVMDLEFTWVNYGTVDDPNFFLNAVTYQSQTLVNTPFPDYGPYWAQWVSGGEAGYPSAAPIADGVWAYGSGSSAPYRYAAPGSWDGFVYNLGIDPPSVSPVPEPGVLGLLALALGPLLWRRRLRRESACA